MCAFFLSSRYINLIFQRIDMPSCEKLDMFTEKQGHMILASTCVPQPGINLDRAEKKYHNY